MRKLTIVGLTLLALGGSSLCFDNQVAIDKGLIWLSAIQEENGKWKMERFNHHRFSYNC